MEFREFHLSLHMVSFLVNLFLVFCCRFSIILSQCYIERTICARGSTSYFWIACSACLQEMNASIFVCSQLQCHWWILANFLPPLLCSILLPLWLLLWPLVDLPTCKHILASSPTCDCFCVCVSTWNCDFTYDLACNRTCKCVPTCISGCEFRLAFKRAPTCENLLKNDAIAQKLYNTRCSSSSQLNINKLFSIVVMLV